MRNHNNGNMAYRNQNRPRHFGNNYVTGVPMGGVNRSNMTISPWENPHQVANFVAANNGGGNNMRQEQGGMNVQAINLANNLLSNLFRNQSPPSLLDLPRGGNMPNRMQRGGPVCTELMFSLNTPDYIHIWPAQSLFPLLIFIWIFFLVNVFHLILTKCFEEKRIRGELNNYICRLLI